MDRDTFDALTRLFAATPSRRTALAAVLGAGLAGSLGLTEAKKKRRRRKKGSGGAYLTAEAADCLSPGPSANMSGCNYTGDDFSGDDLSSSRMVATIFREAVLVETNLSSSNMRGAIFQRANLCGANLSSSTLTNADFRGANLTRADLSSSACGGIRFNSATTFCGTITCNGVERNDDCPDGPENVCCGCAADQCCAAGACVAGDTNQQCGRNGAPCEECGTCERCENGACQPLKANGSACSQSSECCSGNCFNFVCADLVTNCGPTTCSPPARGCSGNNLCCAGADVNFSCPRNCCGPPATGCCSNGTCGQTPC